MCIVSYGYGGVVSVVITVLKGLGIKVYISGRRLDEAARRAEQLGVHAWTAQIDETIDLFVNAAPVTDKPLENAANFLESLRSSRIVFDHEMPGAALKAYCDQKGLRHIPGTDMYYPQMVAQWSLFLESLALPTSRIQELLEEADKMSKE